VSRLCEQLSCGGRKGQRTHDNQLNNTAEVSNLVHIKGFQLSNALNLPGCSTHSRCSRSALCRSSLLSDDLEQHHRRALSVRPPSAARTRPWRVMTELRQDSQLEHTSHSSNGAPASPVFESEDVLPVRMISPIELSDSKTFYPWRRKEQRSVAKKDTPCRPRTRRPRVLHRETRHAQLRPLGLTNTLGVHQRLPRSARP